MTAFFLYALPDHVTLQQEAAVARGLRDLFPDIDFEHRDGAFLTGDIIPLASQTNAGEPDHVAMQLPPRLLVLEVKTAFAGLLIDTLAGA